MLYKISSESEMVNIYESYTQNFTLNNLTIPLARKLAVAVFIDSRQETEQIQGFKTDDAIYNSGNIIIEDHMRSPVISRSSPDMQKSSIDSHTNFKVPAAGMSSSVESHDYISGLRVWRRFVSIFSVIWKIFTL
ncbi:MAG: hypothetical protein OIN66_05310 [Candidatus Methanoperedens sp.]|nr:hypothetical protein [Candidatus Methanoperedens sp.]